MFTNILVPTDVSECSRGAFMTALEIAKEYGATITLLHVIGYPDMYWGHKLAYGIEITQENLTLNGELGIEQTLRGIDTQGVTIKKEVKPGFPAQIILEMAKEKSIRLIVMGRRGHSPIMGAMLGSVSQKVSAGAECPVVIVP